MRLKDLPKIAREKIAGGVALPSFSLRSLALLGERDCLAAAIVRRSPRGPSIEAIFRAPLEDGLRDALLALRNDCESAGFGEVWRGEIRICLPSRDALFQDFHLPPSSARKAKKTVPLLLDGELPLDEGAFSWKATFAKRDGLVALATIAPASLLEEWRSALDALETGDAEITFFPWPLLVHFPRLKAPAIAVCLEPGGGVVCAIDAGGAPLRIRELPMARGETGAENLARRTRLVLADLDLQPQSLFIYGEYHLPGLKKALSEEYRLPCQALGQDLPIAGFRERLGEDDSARIAALCLYSRRALAGFEKPFFKLKMGRPRRVSWLAPAAVVLALLAGLEIYSLSSALGNLNRAESLRAMMSENIRSALGDAPKGASLGRLSSILNSRLRELEEYGGKEGERAAVAFLEALHKACPPELDIDIYRMSWDAKNARLNGRAATYEEVEALKKQAENLDGIAKVSIVNAATIQGDRKRRQIEFELDLVRGER